PILEKHALQNQYDLYLLTYIDVPWVGDDLRDKPNEREYMFNFFKSTLEEHSRKFITLKGDKMRPRFEFTRYGVFMKVLYEWILL
ncbi:MAG: ATP-binding protein, partial [Thiomicrorhabdus sp.]|nr:ATP-binding protein [Thiomicrorhabdus sp.]